MENNKLCFCGSGKVYKNCHAYIKEESYAGRVFKLYNDVDNKINEHFRKSMRKSPCKSGCSECCSGYFFISEIEFMIILYKINNFGNHEIKKISQTVEKQWNIFKKKYPKAAQNIEKFSTDVDDIQKDLFYESMISELDFSCPMLDKNNNTCRVYNERPIICRCWGTGYVLKNGNDHNLCSKICNANCAREWQADLSTFGNEIKSLCYITYNEKTIYRREYPLFYWLYLYLCEANIKKSPMYKEYFKQSEEEYKKNLFTRNLLI